MTLMSIMAMNATIIFIPPKPINPPTISICRESDLDVFLCVYRTKADNPMHDRLRGKEGSQDENWYKSRDLLG